MATITTSWTTIASKTWKSGSFNVKFLLQARVISQSVANNSSVIQTRLRSERASYSFGGWPYKFTCSYCTSKSGDSTWTIETENILISPNKTANHNTDGTKSLSLSATAVITGLGMNVSLSGTAILPRINRLAIVSSGVDFVIDGSGGQSSVATNPTIKFSNPANYQLQPYLEIYKGSTKVATITRTKGSYTSPYNFNLTQAERDNFLQNNTTANQYNVREGITTYHGNSNLGSSYVTKKIDVVGHAEANYSYEDTNPTTIAITGDNQKIIQNQSTLQINLSNIVPYQNAPIVTASATYNSITYNGTISGNTATIPIGTIDSTSDVEVRASLRDSRGNLWFMYIPISVLSWQTPTANITLQRQNNYYSETDIKVDANYSSLDRDNVITIKERHKKTSEQNYSAYTTLTDNVTSTMTLDNLYEWDVQVLVQDLLGSTTYNLTLDKGMPIIYFDRLKRSISINSFPQNNESLEVLGGDILEIIGDKTDTWSSSGSYAKDSFVTYERYIYKNKTGSNSGTPDSDSTNWDKVSVLDLIRSVSSGGGGGTTNYNDLGNKPSINGVTLSGNKTTSDLGIVIPTTTSQLTNNSGFITNSVNNLTNYTLSSALSSVATSGSYNDLTNKPTIPTQTSQLTNNSGFITNSVNDLTNYTKTSDLGAVALSNDYDDLDNKPTIPTIPTNVSSFTNDAGYLTSITSSDVTTALGYTPQEEIDIIDVSSWTKSKMIDVFNHVQYGELFRLKEVTPDNAYYYEPMNFIIESGKSIFDYIDENDNIKHIEITYDGVNNPNMITSQIALQERITSSNKLDYSLLDNTPTIGNAIMYYGVCDTGSFTGTKQVTISNFVLESGATVIIKFTHGNDYTNTPLLQINNETAKYMKIGSNTLTYKWGANAVLTFVYDGTDFILIEPQKATSSIYGLTTLTDSVSSTSTTSSATPNSVKQAYDLADSKQDALVSGTNIKTINNTSLLGSGNITIGGGGTATDVKINGTSITSGGEADIITEGTYNSSTNKIATMSDIPTVPSNVSAFTNDAGYITSSDLPQDSGWQTITPTNGTAGTGYYVPQYRKIGKLVTMRGYITVKNTTAMFNLPTAYRPSARLTFAGTNDNRNVNEIRITEGGDVRLLGTTGNLSSGVPCFLDNISYFVD